MPARRSSHLTSRQSELFDRLVTLVLAEGFQHLTMDDLTSRLSCSKTTLYALADSREQLISAAVVHFFRGAAERIESKVAAVSGAGDRLLAYLDGVATELKPASPAFYDDVAAFTPAREIYHRNTELAAGRVQQLIREGSATKAFRAVNAAFVGEVAAAAMVQIQRRQIATSTSLSDADAYLELAQLLIHGLGSPGPG